MRETKMIEDIARSNALMGIDQGDIESYRINAVDTAIERHWGSQYILRVVDRFDAIVRENS